VDLRIEHGWTDPGLAEEFPQLGVRLARTGAGGRRRSPPVVQERLRLLSDRYTGGKAINLRQQPVPWAYRVFFRQIGIDPDDRRTPAEEAALERMRAGSFASRGLVDDALTVAVVETGVAVTALDADRVSGEVGLRLTRPGERLGGDGRVVLSAGSIVIADAVRSLGFLFGEVAEGFGAGPRTADVQLCAVRVKGVPEVAVEEALWTAAEMLAEGQ
jgi:DNA/RNA-binding domain of Phe-tRNA-synthetase-like protein